MTEPTAEFPTGQNPESSSTPEHINYAGYARLVANSVNVISPETDYRSELTPKEKREGEERMLELFKDREKADEFIGKFRQAIDSLPEAQHLLLNLYYGLDNPENKGRSFKEAGQLASKPIGGDRTRILVRTAERTLRRPDYSVFFQDLFPR